MFYTLGPRLAAKLHPLDGFTVRVSENARRMVLFFGQPALDTEGIEYGGTGFLVLYREEGSAYCYLVTAAHVARRIVPDHDIVIRVNDKEGGSKLFRVDSIFWAYHPDRNVDVAVTPCYLNPAEYDVAYYELADRVRPNESPFRVQCGDPISIVGVFRLHAGSKRNVPIAHSGNIAVLPDPNELIPVKDRVGGEPFQMEAYLVEVQTLEGLSGAPVFQREIVALLEFPKHNGGHPVVATGSQLLGVYSAAWDGEPDTVIAVDRNLRPDKRIPVGMGIVVPIERVIEVIMNDDELKKRRARQVRKKLEDGAAVMDGALSDRPANGENPTH
jgi:hypothetical protein